MSRRIVERSDAIYASGNDFAVTCNNGSERAATILYILYREADSLTHKFFVCHYCLNIFVFVLFSSFGMSYNIDF